MDLDIQTISCLKSIQMHIFLSLKPLAFLYLFHLPVLFQYYFQSILFYANWLKYLQPPQQITQYLHKYHMARFDWFPYLQGKYLNYYQWFGVIASTVLFLLGFFSFIFYLIFCKISPPGPYSSLAPWKKTMVEKIKNILFNGSFVCITIIPLIWQALDGINPLEGFLGMMLVSTIQIYLDNGRLKWTGEHGLQHRASALKTYIRLCLKLTPQSKKLLKIALVAAVVSNVVMYKTCISFFNAEVGFYSDLVGFGMNTYVTRQIQLRQSCPPGPPCQMYATVPEEASYAFFMNVHTHRDVGQVTVFYQLLDEIDPLAFKSVVAEGYDYHGLESLASRKVHSALITGLKPDTKYFTKIFYNNQNWTNAVYRTLPDDNSRPIRMINAGDSGYTPAAINLSMIASTLQPDIFFMGGDIAYDDNMPACAYTWDYFLGMYGRLTSTLGYLMPIVCSVGNHDVGLNELPGINVTINNYGPAYFIYFPQHYDMNLDGHIIKRVPPIKHRRSVFGVQFANTYYQVLDSGYLHHFQGYQKEYMINAFEQHRNKIKFVNYHVPIYSACQSFDRDPARYLYALFHWVPNFDKYKVMTVYQNHVHAFKRTKPMIGNTPKENGTVYVGDGAYGAIKEEFCRPDITVDIFDAFGTNNNFWISDIYADRVEHIAYDSHGKIIDKFSQDVEAYMM